MVRDRGSGAHSDSSEEEEEEVEGEEIDSDSDQVLGKFCVKRTPVRTRTSDLLIRIRILLFSEVTFNKVRELFKKKVFC
jgi:hypothetical protein